MVKIRKDVWREYLIPVKGCSENNLVERVSHSLQVEHYADKEGNLVLINVKNFLEDYGLFFEEGLIDFIAKETAAKEETTKENETNNSQFCSLSDLSKPVSLILNDAIFDLNELNKLL